MRLQRPETAKQRRDLALHAAGRPGLIILLLVALAAASMTASSGCRLTTAPTIAPTTAPTAVTSTGLITAPTAATSSPGINTTAGSDITPIADIADASVDQRVTIRGEIFDIERHSGGNIKLTCKDATGQITVFVPADVGLDALNVTTGETYLIGGIIQVYRDQLELVPEYPDDVVRTVLKYVFPAVQVVSVVDGDTLHVRYDGGRQEKVRIVGIDSPELAKDGQPAEFFAEQARDDVTALLLNKTVYLEQDNSDVDRYGRQLRYVWLEQPDRITADAVRTYQVSSILLSKGHASFVEIGLDNKYEAIFREDEKQARENHQGLWSD